MTPLPQMERVIDYAHSPYKSELLDLYLISQCRFLLGHNSGPDVVANLLRKPRLLVNMEDWSSGMLLKKGDLGIIKHVFSLCFLVILVQSWYPGMPKEYNWEFMETAFSSSLSWYSGPEWGHRTTKTNTDIMKTLFPLVGFLISRSEMGTPK